MQARSEKGAAQWKTCETSHKQDSHDSAFFKTACFIVGALPLTKTYSNRSIKKIYLQSTRPSNLEINQ